MVERIRSDEAAEQAPPPRKPVAAPRRPAVELLVVVLATGVHLTGVVTGALREQAVPGIVQAARAANRCGRRALTIAGSGTNRGWRAAKRWWVDLRAAAEPLQQDAFAAWQHLTTVEGPAAARAGGRLLRATAHGVAVGAGAVARAAGRMAPSGGAPPARRLAVAAPRILVAVLVLAGTGWFAPGPVLQLAARQVDLRDPPFRPLAQRSVVLTADGTPLGIVHAGENRRVVPLSSVPPLVRRLVLVAEDHRFFEHEGFDQSALVRAGLANARAGEVTQGGSTISQQLVKQNIVGDDRTPLRKVRELILAVAVERSSSKDQLLERYLNQVYFGAGAYGIAAAAETYFGTTPEHLRAEQTALLAALIRSPTRLDPWSDRVEIRARRNDVLRVAGEEGVLDDGAVHELSARDLGLLDDPATPRVFDPDLMGVVEREIARRPELGPDPSSRLRRFRSGGWRVETTIAASAQAAAERALDDRPSTGMPSSGAVAVVEPGTGRIRALHSRRPPQLAQLELASAGRRQPGSAFKPLAAVAALEAGLDPAQPLEGRTGLRFRVGDERWPVDNFGDRDHGPVDLARALRDSVNSAFAQLGVAVGTEQLADVATRFGIDAPAALGPPSERGPATALGGIRHGVTPLELAAAYASIANDGVHVEPTIIERIQDAEGRQLLARAPQPRRAVDPTINQHVRSMLKAVILQGTGTRASVPGWEAFGKTGTSQDGADAWFVGAVPTLAAAVWLGDAEGRTAMPEATGGGIAAPIWRSVMTHSLRGSKPIPFSSPGSLPPRPGLVLPAAEPGAPPN